MQLCEPTWCTKESENVQGTLELSNFHSVRRGWPKVSLCWDSGKFSCSAKHSFAANQRFIAFYGQRPAQLDRLQEMFPADVVQHRWLMTVANSLMWAIPLRYTSYLDDLYVNEEVYADQWTHFMSICLADWTSSLSWVRWHIEPEVDMFQDI